MVLTNELKKLDCHKKEILEIMTILLSPFAPFITEELWHHLGNTESVHHASFPVLDESYLKEDTISYPICVNGKKRTMREFPSDASKEELESLVLKLKGLSKWISGKEIKRGMIVPGRMINIVV